MKTLNLKKFTSKGYREINGGFTIIELMIATIIFSIVLLVILASFLQVGRMFYKGVSVSNTNEAARSFVDNISNDIRFSKTEPTIVFNDGAKYYLCVGGHRYTFILGRKVLASDTGSLASAASNTMNAGLVQDRVTATGVCPPPATAGANAQQLLGPDMQLNRLDLTCSKNRCNLKVRVVYYGADDKVFEPSVTSPDAQCSGSLLSTQFCAVSYIETNLLIRE